MRKILTYIGIVISAVVLDFMLCATVMYNVAEW